MSQNYVHFCYNLKTTGYLIDENNIAFVLQNSHHAIHSGYYFYVTESHYDSVLLDIAFAQLDTLDVTSPHSSVVRALDLETRGCGFHSRACQPNNY